MAGLPLTKEEEDLVAERCSYQEQNKKGEVEYMYVNLLVDTTCRVDHHLLVVDPTTTAAAAAGLPLTKEVGVVAKAEDQAVVGQAVVQAFLLYQVG